MRDLTLAIILATRIKFEPPIEVVPPRPGQAFALIHLPVTPAVLLASTALNVLRALPRFSGHSSRAISAGGGGCRIPSPSWRAPRRS